MRSAKINSAKHSFKTALAINKGKLSTCTMSNEIEYEYVTGGPLKGGQPASKGGRMLPSPTPPPPKETLQDISVASVVKGI